MAKFGFTHFDDYNKLAKEFNRLVVSKEPVSNELVREIVKSLSITLLQYDSEDNWVEGKPQIDLPFGIASDIARNMIQLYNGHIPNWMLNIQKRGTPKSDPKEIQSKKVAVHYKQACDRGDIVDESPVKTLAEAYGVSRRAIQQWIKSYPDDDDIGRMAPNELRDRMVAEASLYQSWGRGPSNRKKERLGADREKATRRERTK